MKGSMPYGAEGLHAATQSMDSLSQWMDKGVTSDAFWRPSDLRVVQRLIPAATKADA